MEPEQLKAVFDKLAAGYEQQITKLAPIHAGLYFQLEWIFADLPQNARIMCVGLGTGKELSYLANKFPNWQFTAIEPSAAMLNLCRQRAEKEGFISRCQFHNGYVESLDDSKPYDAATCFMVSQFILDNEQRSYFFRTIAKNLKPKGILVSADLSSEVGSAEYNALLKIWAAMLNVGKVPVDTIEKLGSALARDVAILAPSTVESIIKQGGFDSPVQFYQASLVHAWFALRSK